LKYNEAWIKKLKADLEYINNDVDNGTIYESEKKLLMIRQPNTWNIHIKGNMEIEMEVGFEKFLIAITEQCNERIDELSTFRFYVLLDYLEEKHKK